MSITNPYYEIVLVDLECTCAPPEIDNSAKSVSGEDASLIANPEIIEIGAVLVELSDFSVKKTFQSFVKPVLHPTLTSFCTDLTSIKQSDADNAPGFVEAFDAFTSWCENGTFYSWGKSDLDMFFAECCRHQIPMPFTYYVDLKKVFAKANRIKPRVGLSLALSLTGITPDSASHRAVNDCMNTVKLFPFIFGQEICSGYEERIQRNLGGLTLSQARQNILNLVTSPMEVGTDWPEN